MTLVFDRRAELGDGPGTHVLLCAINDYPHLPGGSGKPTEFHFGLGQLNSPVQTATAIHDWLLEHRDQLAAPLATLRLLLAPGPAEKDLLPGADVEPPTLDNVLRAAAEWRSDASANRDSLTIFYISGQGFVISRADQIVLLHDYGDGIGSILRNSINVGSLFQGMAPTTWTPEIARTQLFLVDSGVSFETLPPELGSSAPTQVFDLPPEPGTDRVAITFSPAPGGVAYGEVGGLTIFGSSLLDCLNGLAAEQVGPADWAVTTVGLVRALPEAVSQRTAAAGVSQTLTAGGLVGSALVARLEGPPEADLAITFPDDIRDTGAIAVRDRTFTAVDEHAAPLVSPLNVRLPAGVYVVELTVPGKDPQLQTVTLTPTAVTHLTLGPES